MKAWGIPFPLYSGVYSYVMLPSLTNIYPSWLMLSKLYNTIRSLQYIIRLINSLNSRNRIPPFYNRIHHLIPLQPSKSTQLLSPHQNPYQTTPRVPLYIHNRILSAYLHSLLTIQLILLYFGDSLALLPLTSSNTLSYWPLKPFPLTSNLISNVL